MKKHIIILIICIILISIGTLFFLNIKNESKFKYDKEDNSYELQLSNVKENETRAFKINKDYTIKYKFKKIKDEELFFNIYVNDIFITKSSVTGYTNHEFDVDEVYLYGDTLVYFSDGNNNKDELFMYVINDNKITKLEPEYDTVKGLRIHGFIPHKDYIEVIASRRNYDDTFTFGNTVFNPCELVWPDEFTSDTIVEATYIYKLKNNKLTLNPKITKELTYKEYLIEGDEIICE